MTKEGKALIFSMLLNFSVSSMKIIAGIICASKSMLADGFHSLSDFITDIVAFFGSKFSNKRADRKHPECQTATASGNKKQYRACASRRV